MFDDQRKAGFVDGEGLDGVVGTAWFDLQFFAVNEPTLVRTGFHRDVSFVVGARIDLLKRPRRGTDIDALMGHFHELIEFQGTVVERAGQTEPMIDQNRFAGFVTLVHAADLRNGGVAFIDQQQIILGKKVEQCVGSRARITTGDVAGVVFNALAEPHFMHHFQIVIRAHFDPLGFEQFVLRLEFGNAALHFLADRHHRLFHLVARCGKLFRGKEDVRLESFHDRACQRINAADAFDFVTEKLQPDGGLFEIRGMDLYHIAAHPELATTECDVVPLEHQLAQHVDQGIAT